VSWVKSAVHTLPSAPYSRHAVRSLPSEPHSRHARKPTYTQRHNPGSVDEYTYNGQSGFTELTASLSAGMTPTFSYWCSDDMLWMDGAGQDGLGPCPNAPEDGSKCGDTVSFYDFKITGE